MSQFVKTTKNDSPGSFSIEVTAKFDEVMIRQKFGWNPDVNPSDAYEMDRWFAANYGTALPSGAWKLEN